jgi:hypothetical protein
MSLLRVIDGRVFIGPATILTQNMPIYLNQRYHEIPLVDNPCSLGISIARNPRLLAPSFRTQHECRRETVF